MKILSGRLDAPTMTGEVLFNGRPLAEVLPRRLAGVAEAEDHHMPFITVRETLEFARNCSQVWTFKNYGPELQVGALAPALACLFSSCPTPPNLWCCCREA